MQKKNWYQNLCILLFRWHDQYKKSWSKQNQDTKVIQKYSYLLHQVQQIVLSLCILLLSMKNEYIEESNGNKYLTLVPSHESKGTRVKNYGSKWEILLGR